MAVKNSSRFTLEEGIQKAIQSYLQDYSAEVIEVTEKVTDEVAKEAVKKLKAESPRSKKKGHAGTYAKGWTYQKDKGRLKTGAIIYGKKGTYNLAHLLEHGHALVGGGRAQGQTKAIPHIEPVEQWAIREMQERITREISWRV